MEHKPIVLIKLGGSVITEKSKEEEVNEEALRGLIVQIQKSGKRVIVVHGAGSFGHPTAKKYRLIEGVTEINEEKRTAVSYTKHRVQFLNDKVSGLFIERGLPAFSLAPSSMFVEEEEGRFTYDPRILLQVLTDGYVPILYGDMVMSKVRHYTVLSGDRIMLMVAEELLRAGFPVETIIFVSDVDGVFTADPKKYPDAVLLEKVTIDNIEETKQMAGGSSNTDVTKGMLGKLLEIEKFLKLNLPVIVLNSVDERLLKFFKGEKVLCSQFLP